MRLGRFPLFKALPVAAGLGGGSSDAAAALRALAAANNMAADDPRLWAAARATGADVPVCLDPRARMMRGVGDLIGPPLGLAPLPAVLVNPGVAVPTPQVFAGLGLARGQSLGGAGAREIDPADVFGSAGIGPQRSAAQRRDDRAANSRGARSARSEPRGSPLAHVGLRRDLLRASIADRHAAARAARALQSAAAGVVGARDVSCDDARLAARVGAAYKTSAIPSQSPFMHLVETPENPVPPLALVEELRAVDGIRLRAARWAPERRSAAPWRCWAGARNSSRNISRRLRISLKRGFVVVALDWRGQGGSERQLKNPRKGHIDDFSLYERDLNALVTTDARTALPKALVRPLPFHGRRDPLEIAEAGRCPFDRLVLSSPMIAISGLRAPKSIRGLVEALDALGLGAPSRPGAAMRSARSSLLSAMC